MDIKELMNLINGKIQSGFAGNETASGGKVYKDEPIITTAAKLRRPVIAKFKEMRRIAQRLHCESDVKIFYEQGVFMEDFEDDWEYEGDFVRYYPTYQSMNDRQLRGYFTWRTRVRNGEIKKTALPFVFVYIYELLNQIGADSPEDGYYKLQNFWEAYKKHDCRLDSHVKMWLRDYVVYYKLDKSFLQGAQSEADQTVKMLLNYEKYPPGEIFAKLNQMSSYNFENSKLYKTHPGTVEKIVCNIYAGLSEYYSGTRPNEVCGNLFGRTVTADYKMFRSAVFYERMENRNDVYEISETHRYICRNGVWRVEQLYCYGGKIKRLGAILKAADSIMRRELGFKYPMKETAIAKPYREIITEAILKYLKDKSKGEKAKIKIDVSKLEGIRSVSDQLQRKLVVEENESGGILNPPEKEEPEGLSDEYGLSELQRELLQRLLRHGEYESLLAESGAMISVETDSINEKLFDLFGDSVIDCSRCPEIVEDYKTELEEILGL